MKRNDLYEKIWAAQYKLNKIFVEYEMIQYIKDDITMSGTEGDLLTYIGLNPDCTITEISEFSGKTTSAAAQIIKKLLKKDLIVQNRNPENRRKFNLTLTEKGRTIFEDSFNLTIRGKNAVIDNLYDFSDEELQTYLKIQKKIDEAYIHDLKMIKDEMERRRK